MVYEEQYCMDRAIAGALFAKRAECAGVAWTL